MVAEVERMRVAVPSPSRDYDAVYGPGVLDLLPALLDEAGAAGRVVVCSDETVAALHAERVLGLLRAAGREPILWTMPAGEAHKTLVTVEGAYAWLASRRIERRDTLIALGGGVVGDLAGFVAATYLRGLRVAQIPTTLVAQVDSALGGKVGVDLPAGKNMVGAFHQPAFVLADTRLLATLPEREWRAGLAEVIKSGLIRDRGLVDVLEREGDAIGRRDEALVADVVERAARVKVDVVVRDPFEAGERRILNYGHTFGHAIERVAGYGVVLHGEAVGWGMAAAARIAERIGLCAPGFAAWQDDLLRAYGLLEPLPPLDAAALLAATGADKKVVGGRVQWIMPREAGDVTITPDVPPDVAREAAEWLAAVGPLC